MCVCVCVCFRASNLICIVMLCQGEFNQLGESGEGRFLGQKHLVLDKPMPGPSPLGELPIGHKVQQEVESRTGLAIPALALLELAGPTGSTSSRREGTWTSRPRTASTPKANPPTCRSTLLSPAGRLRGAKQNRLNTGHTGSEESSSLSCHGRKSRWPQDAVV